MDPPQVIFYAYKGSPFGNKGFNILALKHISYSRVEVSNTLPRPELSELMGITYRRIPVVAIGNDVYCDSSLIASALERRFPKSKGYPTLFPARKGGGSTDTGLVKAFSMYYGDRAVFASADLCLPYQKFPDAFVKDRGDYFGAPMDPQALVDRLPLTKSTLASHLTFVEEQLSDGREWLFDTETPSLADISLHFSFAWIMIFRAVKDLFDPITFPRSTAWIARMSKYLEGNTNPEIPTISGHDAAKIITSGLFEDDVGFDIVEGQRLGLELGQIISIAPDDTGKNHPTTGKLVALNREEFVIEVQGSLGSPVRCHLPRLSFNLETEKSKL